MGHKRWAKFLHLAVKALVVVAIIVVMALLLAPKACQPLGRHPNGQQYFCVLFRS